MNIQDLLIEPGQQDKFQNLSTTSLKFKEDLWNFFNREEFKQQTCCEFGTHKGQTTRILSFLFNRVITINLPGHFEEAKAFNADRTNIEFLGFDLYSRPETHTPTAEKVDVFFVDANHEYNEVMHDVEKIRNMNLGDDVYIIFDDFGGQIGVNIAVNDLIEEHILDIVSNIGYPAGHSFGGSPERILKDWEGVICRLNKKS